MSHHNSEYFALLVQHETALWNAIDKGLKDTKGAVTLGRLEVLRAIRDLDGQGRIQDAAGSLGTTVGAASRLVDRMETDGLVERSPHPTDRRSSRLKLTTAGTGALSISEAGFASSMKTALAGANPADLELLSGALGRVHAALLHTTEVAE